MKDLRRKTIDAPKFSDNELKGLKSIRKQSRFAIRESIKMSRKIDNPVNPAGCTQCEFTGKTRAAIQRHWEKNHQSILVLPEKKARKSRAITKEEKAANKLGRKCRNFV